MRGILSMIFLLIFMVFPAAAEEKLKPWQIKALQLLKQEKKVLDAWWRMPSRNILFIAMRPDGTRKDGFAEYVCMLLADTGAPKGKLKIVEVHDPATFQAYKEHTGSGSSMGMAACR